MASVRSGKQRKPTEISDFWVNWFHDEALLQIRERDSELGRFVKEVHRRSQEKQFMKQNLTRILNEFNTTQNSVCARIQFAAAYVTYNAVVLNDFDAINKFFALPAVMRIMNGPGEVFTQFPWTSKTKPEHLEEALPFVREMCNGYFNLLRGLCYLYLTRTDRDVVDPCIQLLWVYFGYLEDWMEGYLPELDQVSNSYHSYMAGKALDATPGLVFDRIKGSLKSKSSVTSPNLTQAERSAVYDINSALGTLIQSLRNRTFESDFPNFDLKAFFQNNIAFIDQLCERVYCSSPAKSYNLEQLDPEFACNIVKAAFHSLPFLGCAQDDVWNVTMEYMSFFRSLYGKCGYCGTETKQSCSRCKIARFCSSECQRMVWPYHKKVCGKETFESLKLKMVKRPWNDLLEKEERPWEKK